MASNGIITQVIGSTFDAEFPEDSMPAIYNAINIGSNDHQIHRHRLYFAAGTTASSSRRPAGSQRRTAAWMSLGDSAWYRPRSSAK